MAQHEGRPLLRVTPSDLNQASRTFSEWEGPIGLTHVTHRARELGAVLFIDEADPLARRRPAGSGHNTLAERLALYFEHQDVPVIYGFARRPTSIDPGVIQELDSDASR
ncbi:hypothetical protein CKO28_13785 [Rhodovibrio sodomensis]|uniref:ATPase AAA-type core domain-containing protein n=1 Tax=Rhodovibrio sodomensis TaxID=1088 RepID=A0ABS1DF68_9PROT|nr:hypothetical protein [Rhodovibrio sodomensis]MBK1669105.1 hypothetical protein [Rhodovibrio sodomensis]